MTEFKERLAIIAYLVKKLPEITSNQVGKTTIQKLIYLLGREGVGDYHYTMYHYGPYSGQLSSDLIAASNMLHFINITWVDNKGYDITINPGSEGFIEKNIQGTNLKKIDKILKEYGNFNTIELSLISTAYYVLDNFQIETEEQLIEIVASIKPDYTSIISTVLAKAGVTPLKMTSN